MPRRTATAAGLTRRALAGALAAPALVGMSARLAAADADVLIIGAGAAGIAAAHECRRLRLTYRLIEARDRLGGRAFTDHALGAPFDAGAEIIHFADRNPWVEIARGLGETLDSGAGRFGGWQAYAGGRPLSPEARGRRWQAFRTLEERQRQTAASGVDRSIADLVADLDPESRAVAQSGLLLVLGEDGHRISALDNQSLWDGPDLTTRGGYGALVAAHGRGLDAALGVPVAALDWSGGGVRAVTPAGDVRARAAVLTVSVGVLKSGAVRLTPEPPAEVLAALNGIGMGALTKIALRLEGDRFGLSESSYLVDVTRPEATLMIEMFPRGLPLAVAIAGGDFARGLCEAGEAAAVDHVAAALGGMLGAQARRAVTGGRLAPWWTDPLARGGYSVARPDHAGARAVLARPIGGRVWLAGEATGEGGAMTVGGATIAGRRAVGEIAAALSR